MDDFETVWKISDWLKDFKQFYKISGQSWIYASSAHECWTIQTAFTGEIHWNGIAVLRADHFLSATLDGWFGSRGR